MTSFVESRQRAIALIEKLSQDKLGTVIQMLELLAEPGEEIQAADREKLLLSIIQQELPKDEQVRLKDLRHRCEWEELSQAEQKELVGYEDKKEQLRTARVAALIELANLKNTDIVTLRNKDRIT